jgi:hypothetical protein
MRSWLIEHIFGKFPYRFCWAECVYWSLGSTKFFYIFGKEARIKKCGYCGHCLTAPEQSLMMDDWSKKNVRKRYVKASRDSDNDPAVEIGNKIDTAK